MDYVRRINLKTDCKDRKELLKFCLENKSKQYVAIGWSYIYNNDGDAFEDYQSFYYAVEKSIKEQKTNGQRKRINHALNSFWYVEEGDLFWTRDLHGFYWLCRAKGPAESYCDKGMDIGAVVPVNAYLFGLEVPGQIKESFNRANGGIIHEIRDQGAINYSQYIYNKLSGKDVYKDITKVTNGLINNLPAFDLEELVICYLQIVGNYYVLSNSIARKSTTIEIECELLSRNKNHPEKAVVQVKAKEDYIDYSRYKEYVEKGYRVYLYDGGRENINPPRGYTVISRKTLEDFYSEYKTILPDSIIQWENIYD